MRCKSCGYDLRGLTAPRCPECHQQYDPGRPITYLSEPVSGRKACALAAIGAILPVVPPLLVWLQELGMMINLRRIPDVFWLFGPLLMISGVTVSFYVLSLCVRAFLGKLRWTTHDWSFGMAFAIVLLGWFLLGALYVVERMT